MQILTGNRIGTMNIFDIRSNDNKPSHSLKGEDERRGKNGITCITYHPVQKHIVSDGYFFARNMLGEFITYIMITGYLWKRRRPPHHMGSTETHISSIIYEGNGNFYY